MRFTETKLQGAYIIELERREDSRGFFARAFCQKEFGAHGLKPLIAQANVAYNFKKGTLRGMHFQFPPAAETKLVHCATTRRRTTRLASSTRLIMRAVSCMMTRVSAFSGHCRWR